LLLFRNRCSVVPPDHIAAVDLVREATFEAAVMEFQEKAERDGFQLKTHRFAPPADLGHLDSTSRRELTICNLFANHRLPIRDIARILDEQYGRVVHVLIRQGIVYERRKNRPGTISPAEQTHTFFRTLK
jgi:hypothetical protein